MWISLAARGASINWSGGDLAPPSRGPPRHRDGLHKRQGPRPFTSDDELVFLNRNGSLPLQGPYVVVLADLEHHGPVQLNLLQGLWEDSLLETQAALFSSHPNNPAKNVK